MQVIDRILYKLDDLVRPYVHKILVVIEPLLIDEDYYARVEGREIISNLAKVNCVQYLLVPLSILKCDASHCHYHMNVLHFMMNSVYVLADIHVVIKLFQYQ